ncbi:hypothetical protein [Oerskovia paurometabola]|uniref:hypothetical protein n=1 Tax=Oerskovia paurometabola TaxID=162170 RepID=UPI003800F376
MPAPTAPNVERLTRDQLDALPMGAVVRFLDDPGRRHVVAFKSGERVRGVDYTRWLLSDGGVFLSAVALADAGAVLHDPVPPVVDETALAAALGDVWDEGNAAGLDGWTGPGRGSLDVDQYAVIARERAVRRALARLQGRERS